MVLNRCWQNKSEQILIILVASQCRARRGETTSEFHATSWCEKAAETIPKFMWENFSGFKFSLFAFIQRRFAAQESEGTFLRQCRYLSGGCIGFGTFHKHGLRKVAKSVGLKKLRIPQPRSAEPGLKQTCMKHARRNRACECFELYILYSSIAQLAHFWSFSHDSNAVLGWLPPTNLCLVRDYCHQKWKHCWIQKWSPDTNPTKN